MAHGGGSPVNILFCDERGYAIQRGEKPWCDLYDWPKEVELQHGLVPIRPAICAIVWNTVAVTDSFAQVLERTIQLPKELFPGLKYYSRGYHDREFHQINEVLKNSWWCETRLPDQPVENKPQAPIPPEPSS
jgi:prepilin-type processing-associated H-X9-DG protein